MCKLIKLALFMCLGSFAVSCEDNKKENSKMQINRYLSEMEKQILVHKGTERPGTGALLHNKKKGIYSCRNCGSDLYESAAKFESGCGWPSFDDEIEGRVKRTTDADGRRTEITCRNCGGHLGHVFLGEGFTEKSTRHCVNSLSLRFTPANWKPQKAYFAGGCFWGVEHYLQMVPGVSTVVSGYSGGQVESPSYKQVCYEDTGHLEAVEVTYNPYKVSFEELAKMFFEIHDPTQTNGQGPDLGAQYLSAVFYTNEDEKEVAKQLIKLLEEKGYKIATKLIKFEKFWPAEAYHQDYYERKGTLPYCHGYTKRF